VYEAWQEHVKIARRAARAMARPGADFDDLYAAGLVGLWQASQKYDPGVGVGFGPYAKPRVRGAITDHLRATFGRSGKHQRVGRCHPDIPSRDRGLEMVDVRDELAHATRDPVELPRSDAKSRRVIAWRGRAMLLEEWAKEIGITAATLYLRIKRWGLREAFERPADTRYQ
jgi:RNA polymerase sigma factor (sigma-70 family)